MKRACLLFAVFAAALAACGAEPVEQAAQPPPSAEAPFILDPNLPREGEILRAIEGYRLIYDFGGPPPHDSATGESFMCGGNWSRDGGRGAEGGTYSIDGDMICVTRPRRNGDRTDCRRFISSDGETLVLDAPELGEVSYRLHRNAYCEADPNGGPSYDRRILRVHSTNIPHLSDAELRSLIRGATITDAPPDNYFETFGCDYFLSVSGTRGPLPFVRYEISNGALCVGGPEGECSRFYRRGDAYYRGGVESNGEVVVARHVEIAPGTCER